MYVFNREIGAFDEDQENCDILLDGQFMIMNAMKRRPCSRPSPWCSKFALRYTQLIRSKVDSQHCKKKQDLTDRMTLGYLERHIIIVLA